MDEGKPEMSHATEADYKGTFWRKLKRGNNKQRLNSKEFLFCSYGVEETAF